jgi:hypothetical protein
MSLSGRSELHGDQFVTLLFETFDDFSDEASLDAVGFDHDVWSEVMEKEKLEA